MYLSRSNEQDELLQEASRLREEARALEASMDRAPAQDQEKATLTYSKIEDSVWMISFRFSNEPDSDDEERKRRFFSGQLKVLFKADGFTDVLSSDSDLQIAKVWGWDVETSAEDGLEYLLFSMDAFVNDTTQRFYFQARKEEDCTLQEGTVTIKQDIVEAKKTPSMWGLFSPAGILAQFRYVGNFVAKPSRTDD